MTKNDSSGKMYNEKYVRNNYIDIYNDVINFCEGELSEISFKQKVYHYVHNIKHKILCNNPNCNNEVKFKNSTIGYYKYCSNSCVSKDPEIKKIKEKKSYDKYGTKSPGMNFEIKNKMIKTNNERYGGNSPKNNKEVIEKSVKSFFETTVKKNLEKYKNHKNLKILEVDYINKKFRFECDKGHIFDIDMYSFRNRNKIDTVICTICNPISSFSNSGHELQFREYIKNVYEKDILYNDRNITGKEIDIYLPDLKLGFEFNGVYWHNELYKPNDFHLNKTEICEKNNIKLIHVYQDDWLYKQDIVKSRILNLLGKSKKIFARKCEIKEIKDNKIVREFLEHNHLQGFIGSKIKIGLFYKGELVSIMNFGNLRKLMGQKSLEGSYEMLRFCNKLNISVIGGASRLFKYFINNYNPNEIISYADRSWSSGNLYEKLNFKFMGKTKPNYYYVTHDSLRKHRFLFRKDVLIKQGFDPNKTEKQIMLERKIYRIYDSGNLKFLYKKEKGI